jgi:hypothetical protein
MLDALDPASTRLAKAFAASLSLSDAAAARLDGGLNVRRFIDRLLAERLPGDALAVIARTLPVPLLVAWCCECVRAGLDGGAPALAAERAAVALAEQCLREPTDANRQLCLEFAARGRRATAGAWLAMAAAWADGNLTAPGSPAAVAAPHEAIADTVLAALQLAAAGAGAEAPTRLSSYAQRALAAFGPRPASAS